VSIANEILMYFRGQKKKQQDVYISDPIDTDSEGNTLTLIDVIASEDTIIDDIDLKIKIENLYNYIGSSLNSREKSIIEMRYGLNSNVPMTQREVAKKLGISRSYVSRIEKKSLQQLKRRFDNDTK
jgi:RNA polymerase sporulation-specific sigma factor